MGLAYYKRFPRDFLEGTIGLTFEEKGAYSIILDLIYARDGRLPDDARFIAGNLNCSVRKWTAIRAALIEKGKLRIDGGLISNLRADYLLESTRKYQDKQAENRAAPNKNNGLQPPKTDHSRDYPEPEPEKKEDAKASLSAEAGRPLEKPLSVTKADAQAIWQLAPRKARERSSMADVQRALEAASRRGHAVAAVTEGIRRAYANEDATKDAGQYAKGVHRLIEGDRWLSFVEPVVDFHVERLARWGLDEWRAALDRQRETGRWPLSLGPAPGEPGCMVPAELIIGRKVA